MAVIQYATEPGIVAIYRDGRAAIVKHKDYAIVELAKEALCGLIRVPDPSDPYGEAVDWVDHVELMRFAAAATSVAADMMEAKQ